jgi:hypothetical protein
MNANQWAEAPDKRAAEPAQRELLENILAAEVLTLAHIIKANTTVMDESVRPDFHAEAIEEIKRHRSDIITRLSSDRLE